MRFRGILVGLVILGLGLSGIFPAQVALAQRVNRPTDVDCTGSVSEIGAAGLKVVTEKDETWYFAYSPNIIPGEDIDITGEADIAWVQPGMLVRLTAKINTKKGLFLDPISEFEVISLRPEIEPGIKNENEPKDTDEFFNDKEKSSSKKKSQKLPEEIEATIIGEISSLKQGKISIKVPNSKALKGELSEKCKISVNISDPTFIRAGDKVTIKGKYYPDQAPSGGAPGQGMIEKLSVVAASKFEPMKQPKKGQKPYNPKEGQPDQKPAAKGDEKGAAGNKTPPAKGGPAGKTSDKNEKPQTDPKKKP